MGAIPSIQRSAKRSLQAMLVAAYHVAFSTLECRHATLAQTLLDNVGNRQRAAYWMCTHQKAFEGRTAYEVLADGDEDQVWERIPGNPEGEPMNRLERSRMAY